MPVTGLMVVGLGVVLLWLRWLSRRERSETRREISGGARHGERIEDELTSQQLAITAHRPAFWVGLFIGLSVWIATMARYPRVSYGANQTTGNPAIFPLLALAAVVLGAVEPRRPKWMAASLLIAPLSLAYWTTPRGDGDGLWGLIFPILIGFAVLLVGCAQFGGWLRKLLWRESAD